MTSVRNETQRMQLSFILNDDDSAAAHEDANERPPSPPAASRPHPPQEEQQQQHRDDDDRAIPLPRAERARYLQNLRQRRYRARKKSTLSALQRESQALLESNRRLESDVLAQLHALLLRERQRPSMAQAEEERSE